MKPMLLAAILGFSTVLAAFTLFSIRPRRLVLGWLSVGLLQSIFLLVIGFEFLSVLNLLFVVASATVLQVYSALFGTGANFEAERVRDRRDWIYGLGAGLTLAAILAFSLLGTLPSAELTTDLETPIFANEILSVFPELPIVLGVIIFLGIVVTAAIGRPGWKRVLRGRS